MREKAKAIAKKHGYLPYMIERYLSLWGEEETLQFIDACERPIRTAIRVNTLRTSIDETIARLDKKGVNLERVPWLEEGFYAEFANVSSGALFEHLLGFYYVQGIPSMSVVRTLDPKPGEIVFDLAAAPGGKTTHIAQLMNNEGMLIAIEQDKKRVSTLVGNIHRCGVTNTLVLRGDAKKISTLEIVPDRILLDAPCSGEGLIPIDPTRKTSKTMADIRYCATKQDELLEAAISSLRPGGTIVYSTCSIAPEENEIVIDDLLSKHPEVKIVPIGLEFGVPAYTKPYGLMLDESIALARRFLPHIHGLEGFFICKMVKEE